MWQSGNTMDNMKFRYPAEKLSAANRILKSSHAKGEDQRFASAFHECLLGLKDVAFDDLDENARKWAATIRRTIDTTGVKDPSGDGTWFARARQLSTDQKRAFAAAVDALAAYCDRRFHGSA